MKPIKSTIGIKYTNTTLFLQREVIFIKEN